MDGLVIVFLLFVIPLILFVAYLALSSCLGDSIRATISRRRNEDRTRMSFGRNYGRALGSGVGHGAGWEQIEMEDMMADERDLSD
jgi:hypothetical protein